MAQEPSSRDLLEAVKQQESGGRRYKADGRTLLEGPPTKYGTAKGEMQVLDMTNRDPGFGVRPAKDDSPDERARVGRDYLAAMKKRYGDTETGLIAYNWGPGNTDKWLKKGADPAKLPKETQNYVAKIMASLGGPDVSRETSAVAAAPKKAAPKPVAVAGTTPKKPAPVAAPAAAPVTVASMDSKLADLGPSYQAALALSFLADTDEKEDRDIDREPGVAEKYLAEMEAAPRPAALSEFIDVKIRSPFAEAEQPEQPVGMAEGGVVRRAGGSPETGEYFQDPLGVPDSGPVTSDTLSKGKEFSAADALRALKETGTGVARNIKNIAKGTTETPYNLVGSVADIGNMVLTPLGLGSAEPTLGSAQLKRLATEAGIRPAPPTDPRDAGFYMMGELGSSVLNPSGVVRSGVKAATKGKKAAEMLAKDFQAYNQALGPAGVSYAVKPGGGTFGYTPEDLDRAKPITNLAKLVRDYGTEAKDLGAANELVDFLKTKAPKYFTSTYGTANDPLRTGIRNRRIDPFGADLEQIPPYLVDAATNPEARGNLQAKRVLEKSYDDLTGIRAYSLMPENADAYTFRRNTEQGISEKLGQEGVPVEARNLPEIRAFSPTDFEKYPSSTELLRRLYGQEAGPPNIQRALNTSEPIYDVDPRLALLKPANVIEALQQVPVNKLKNMSFPEALIQGTQALAPVRDYLAAVALADKGAKVPRKALDMFTTSVMKAPSFNGQWVTLDKSVATKLEGKLMNHSIGDYNFGASYGTAYTDLPYGGKKAFDEGLVRVYSLRDDQGLPKVTLEMAKSDEGRGSTWNVTQIKGRFNSEPLPETREDIFRLLDKVNGQEGLGKIKTNSYSMSPTGERGETKRVDWDKEYDLWSSEQQRAMGGMVQGYAKGGIADLPKDYDEDDPTTLKPFLPTTTPTANTTGIATLVPNAGNPNAAAAQAASFAKLTPAQLAQHQVVMQAINDAKPLALQLALAVKDAFQNAVSNSTATSSGGVSSTSGSPMGGIASTGTVGQANAAVAAANAALGNAIGGGSGGGTSGGTSGSGMGGMGTGAAGAAASAAATGRADGGMIERQFIDNRRYM